MSVEQGWVHLLQQELGEKVKVVNGSISGETTIGGRTRLPDALNVFQPALVVVALGGNDGLRGMSPQNMRDNLRFMIEKSQSARAAVVLVGIMLPPNYGPAYNRRFEMVFEELAAEYKLLYIPFLLDGVATDFSLMQSDGIHPTAEAQPMILRNILPVIQTSLAN
jgi:acyl-CoA thioesterase-1